jgi:serine/threonine protein kinase
MNTNSRDSHDKRDRQADLAAREIRACSVCGAKFSATRNSEFCPMCMLRQALPDAVESRMAHSEDTVTPPHRFQHYELVKGEDGKAVELGRGAMGITYKAFDVDLRYDVTLKVISARYLGDESVRLRFLREARAAASVRHPNVASVFHLGRTSKSYFYAMEFVEGETLDSLIKRSGRLEVKLALEIATQIASGLVAVHKQKLVHRDIKPNNIMVNMEQGIVTAKIIDLGLAKAVTEPACQTAISIAGGFAGTPEFASPEQCAGVGVDIRSDLYSLGVMLWEMITGHAVFRGSPTEVMYQHQHAPLPLKQLEGVPQPVVVLLKMLLEKDPGRRFENPAELLKAMMAIVTAIDARRRITQQSLRKLPPHDLSAVTRKPLARLGPDKISIARLPITGSNVFGREGDIAFLNDAWTNQRINLVTIVAWAGVGKSALVNHWLGHMAAEHYRSAKLVFGWSFYRQGTSRGTSSADEFLDVALTWFGDPDPRLGTAWEKGERLAKLIAHRRTLLVLDGLEPLQNPPGPQEGRVREPSLQALLRELAAYNMGLCVITTRIPVADVADREETSAVRFDLEHLSRDAGAKLLRALDVKGPESELRTASDEFSGHCLALTLLGSYLTDVYNGDIRWRKEVSEHLGHDIRQGVHARKVMKSYQTWFGEGPELSLLRLLGLFDRPAAEKAIEALLKPPAIHDLTESLTDLNPTEWRTILAKLRRARLISGEDPHNPRHLDSHPLVREYFGEQLRNQRINAWNECNRRLYNYYRALAPRLPDSFSDMEPLFLAVICGCNAGFFREALHEVYIPRIQRGRVSFAANVLGVRGTLLSVLAHFFEHGRWESPVEMGTETQSLAQEDQLFILAQAALYLTATQGMGAAESRICYERMESLCRSVDRPQFLYAALMGQWRYSLTTDKLTATMQFAQLYFMCDFETARQYAMRGVQIWRSGGADSSVEGIDAPTVTCLVYAALSEWQFGEIASSHATMAESISLAKELNDMHVLTNAIFDSACLAYYECNVSEVERLASNVIELSTRYHFAFFLATGSILRGWARSASGDAAEGVSCVEGGIRAYREPGSKLGMPFYLALYAESLYLADRTHVALEAIKEAEALAERFEVRWWCAELRRLRGVFLAALGGDENQIEAAFCEAIRIAKQQKSVSLAKRAEATYAEYHRQMASALGGHEFRLPLC